MGPSGTGKTFMAAGLCFDAVKAGYSAMFRTMDDIVSVLKMKDITRTASAEYKRMLKASLIIIDDIMLFPLESKMPSVFLILLICFLKKRLLSLQPISRLKNGRKC
jgi:DNA replication protein DnaC